MSASALQGAAVDAGIVAAWLASLSIPDTRTPDDERTFHPASPAASARQFVTDEVAAECWRAWNPGAAALVDEPAFRARFTAWLRDGAALALSLDRFREASSQLSWPPAGRMSWITPFEDVVAQCGGGVIHLHLGVAEHDDYKRGEWQGSIALMMDQLFDELGVVFPQIAATLDPSLPVGSFHCGWNDLMLPVTAGLAPGRLLVGDTAERLALLAVAAQPAINPATRAECATIDVADRAVCEQMGATVWDARAYVILCVETMLRSVAPAFVNRSLVELYLHRMAEVALELVELVEQRVAPDLLAQVLRGLVAEGISIRNLPQLLDWLVRQRSTFDVDVSKYIVFPVTDGVLSRLPYEEVTVAELVAMARSELKRYVSNKFAQGHNNLTVYLLAPQIEALLAREHEPSALERRAILAATRDEVGSLPLTRQGAVVLTNMRVRARFRALLQPELPQLHVLSYQEMALDVNIQPIGKIAAPGLDHCALLAALEVLAERLEIGGSSERDAQHLRIVEQANAVFAKRRRDFTPTRASARGFDALCVAIVNLVKASVLQSAGQIEDLGRQLADAQERCAVKPSELLSAVFAVGTAIRQVLARDIGTAAALDAFQLFVEITAAAELTVRKIVVATIEAAGRRRVQ